MTTTYDLDVSGAKAQTVVVPPVNGKNGEPLGASGNGSAGQEGWGTCTKPAGPGLPGNYGTGAPPADYGANGHDACSVMITCSEYSGHPLRLLNRGGDGANGQNGGTGGNGSDGGNAGQQPKACIGVISGGIGGASGNGGDAGSGGNAGNAGDVVVVSGPGFSDVPVSSDSAGGTPGEVGQPGQAGTPGKGGLNSDGSSAIAGSVGGAGQQGQGGNGGYGGSFKATTDKSQPAAYVKISVQSHIST